MNLKYLETFYSIVSEGSFVGASKRLNVTQPAISSSLKKLEKEVGCTLLERTNRGIILTDIGEKLFNSCKTIFDEIDVLTRELGMNSKFVKGSLKIGTSDEIASYLLAKKLDSLCEEFPEVQPDIYISPASELLEKLKNGEIDILILFYTPNIPEGLFEKRLFDVPFKGVVKTDKRRVKSVLCNLLSDNSIFPSHKKKFKGLRNHLKKYQETKVGLSTNSVNMHLQMVVQGEGIAFLPEFMVGPLLESGKLSELYKGDKDSYSLKVVMRNSFIPNKAHKRLIELIQQV